MCFVGQLYFKNARAKVWKIRKVAEDFGAGKTFIQEAQNGNTFTLSAHLTSRIRRMERDICPVKKTIKGFFEKNMHCEMAFYGLFVQNNVPLCNIFSDFLPS